MDVLKRDVWCHREGMLVWVGLAFLLSVEVVADECYVKYVSL